MNQLTRLLSAGLCLATSPSILPFAIAQDEADLAEFSALIPKREVGQPEFLKKHPEWDGRGVVIAIFDTGVDPAAAGLSVTTDGKRKILDILDASGSGDVDTSQIAKVDENGTLLGLSGKSLKLPENLLNPTGEFRLGLKAASDIFPEYALARLTKHEAERWQSELSQLRAARLQSQKNQDLSFQTKAPEDQTLEEQEKAARISLLEKLEDDFPKNRPDIYFDCVLWNDGEHWQVLVDTDRDTDLTDEKQLRPFRTAGEYAVFDTVSNLSFGVQVYEEGDLLSLVTVSGTHGSHVASIAAAHDPENRARDGIAPGAQIISIRIGDPRTGGSSYGTSERRAVALAAQAGVDIVNASWGGPSVYQDGLDGYSQSYDILTERYGIFSVISAGNSGPALSTLGKAGGVSRWALGVGAYVSPEMGKVLYSTLNETEEGVLQFTSRGPSKDGDWGVDLLAPGAAFASYSRESMQGFEMINGTSMAAPSAAGVAALLKSAAKQKGLASDPARMHAAMTLGAKPVPSESASTQGAGLVQVQGAWDKLNAIQRHPAFSAYYDLKVSGSSFAPQSRGLYLRETNPAPRKRILVRVEPKWIEAIPSQDRVSFEGNLKLRSTVDWIETPENFLLSNSQNSFAVFVTVPEPQDRPLGSLFTGEVQAFLAGKQKLGPVFKIPFTIVLGDDLDPPSSEAVQKTAQMFPSKTERWFLNVPPDADSLQVTLKHKSDDPVSRRFVVHGVTLAQQIPQYESGRPNYMRLEANEETTLLLPTIGGQVMELALYQYWSSIGDSELEVKLQWQGLGLSGQPTTFTQNVDWTTLPLRSFQKQSLNVKAKIDQAQYTFMPTQTERVPFDQRGELPPSPQNETATRQMRQMQIFELEFEEPTKASLVDPTTYDMGEFFGGGLTDIYHQSGARLYSGRPSDEKTIDFPKGKSFAIRYFDQATGAKLDQTESLRLSLQHTLKEPAPIPVFASLNERYNGKPADELELEAGHPEFLYLQNSALKKLSELKPAPSYFSGNIEFKNKSQDTAGKATLLYFAGKPFEDSANQAPKPKPTKDERSSLEKLDDDLYERQLAFIRDERGNEDESIQAKRANLIEQLRQDHPQDPTPVFEAALAKAIEAGLASKEWKGPETETTNPELAPQIEALLDQARSLTNPAAISQFKGAKKQAAPGDPAARHAIKREEDQIEKATKTLVSIEQLRADLKIAIGDSTAAREALLELSRWEDKPSKTTQQLWTSMYQKEGHYAKAIESLNAQLKEDPYSESLLQERIEYYRKLGWDQFADSEEQTLAIQAQGKRALTSHNLLGKE